MGVAFRNGTGVWLAGGASPDPHGRKQRRGNCGGEQQARPVPDFRAAVAPAADGVPPAFRRHPAQNATGLASGLEGANVGENRLAQFRARGEVDAAKSLQAGGYAIDASCQATAVPAFHEVPRQERLLLGSEWFDLLLENQVSGRLAGTRIGRPNHQLLPVLLSLRAPNGRHLLLRIRTFAHHRTYPP